MPHDHDRDMPLIGVTGLRRLGSEVGRMPPFLNTTPVDAFVTHYSASVTAAGGLPVLLARTPSWHSLIERLDGIVLTGGEDVEPRRYGGLPTSHSAVLDVERDQFELELIDAARAIGLPILAICRGTQVLNVAMGGTLVQHLSPDEGERHSFFGYPGDYRSHTIRSTEGSQIAALYGPVTKVNSFHHQAVETVGRGLTGTAVADDGVIEGIESEDGLAIGVQWHPEMLNDDPLFEWLVGAARRK
ncbi:MAG: gamma-glutamyl-gamma-aminobutyrate hydrolase family protein [Microbacteriaceae bacterium]|jgi:putative glutamine amidotransferase